jgi:hypothetical protein
MFDLDYNDGESVECQVGRHVASVVGMCTLCDNTMCEEHEGEDMLCIECERDTLLDLRDD